MFNLGNETKRKEDNEAKRISQVDVLSHESSAPSTYLLLHSHSPDTIAHIILLNTYTLSLSRTLSLSLLPRLTSSISLHLYLSYIVSVSFIAGRGLFLLFGDPCP